MLFNDIEVLKRTFASVKPGLVLYHMGCTSVASDPKVGLQFDVLPTNVEGKEGYLVKYPQPVSRSAAINVPPGPFYSVVVIEPNGPHKHFILCQSTDDGQTNLRMSNPNGGSVNLGPGSVVEKTAFLQTVQAFLMSK